MNNYIIRALHKNGKACTFEVRASNPATAVNFFTINKLADGYEQEGWEAIDIDLVEEQ